MHFMEKILLFLIFLILFGVGMVAYKEIISEKITLNKTEWSCTQTKPQSTLLLVGKVLVPTTTQVCSVYTRN